MDRKSDLSAAFAIGRWVVAGRKATKKVGGPAMNDKREAVRMDGPATSKGIQYPLL